MNVLTRLLALALLATASVCWLSGCSDKNDTPQPNKQEQKKDAGPKDHKDHEGGDHRPK